MKSDTITRLKRLEEALKQGDGVIIVDRVDNGYKLPDGEVLADLDALRGRYGVILVDDVKYHLDHPEEWTDFERFCAAEDRRLNPQNYTNKEKESE